MDVAAELAKVGAFAELEADEREALARAMVLEQHRAGHVFVREGEARRSVQDAAWVVLAGRIHVTRADDASKAVDRELGPGDLFGLVALVDRGPRSATCTALTDVTTASLNRSAFEHLLRSNAELACKFQLVVARQLARDFDRLQRVFREAVAKG